MKLKKLLCILLCAVICVTTLVSCGEGGIGSWSGAYGEPEPPREEIALNMYIIVGEGTTKNAITTVQNMINQYTKSNFSTILTVHYLTEAEYEDKVMADIAADKTNTPIGGAVPEVDILLVTSADMMDQLMDGQYLLDLTSYFNTDTYGKLNTNIAESLLLASKIDGKFYCVPNNHVVGSYEYLVINKAKAEELNYGPKTITTYDTMEKCQELCDAIAANGDTVEDFVYEIKNGKYEDKAAIEASGEWVCNIVKKPVVTAEEAFASAFAVSSTIDEKNAERCFEILYALNMDVYFRNLLQYGVNVTNYTIDENEVVTRKINDENNAYNMNILYTGNLFKAYFCEELGWTKTAKTNGEAQNNDSTAN